MLLCDVRPLVAGGGVDQPLVNPYATPRTCKCSKDPEIKPRFQCDWHNCCRMTAKIVPCPAWEKCEKLVMFHKYVRRNVELDEALDLVPATAGEGWAPLPVIDGEYCDVDVAPPITAEFAAVRELFLEKAKGMYDGMVRIEEIMSESRERSTKLANMIWGSRRKTMGGRLSSGRQFLIRHIEDRLQELDRERNLVEAELETTCVGFERYSEVLEELVEEGLGTISGLDAWSGRTSE